MLIHVDKKCCDEPLFPSISFQAHLLVTRIHFSVHVEWQRVSQCLYYVFYINEYAVNSKISCKNERDLDMYINYSDCSLSLLAHALLLKEMTKLRVVRLFAFKWLGRLPRCYVKAVTVWNGNEPKDVYTCIIQMNIHYECDLKGQIDSL